MQRANWADWSGTYHRSRPINLVQFKTPYKTIDHDVGHSIDFLHGEEVIKSGWHPATLLLDTTLEGLL